MNPADLPPLLYGTAWKKDDTERYVGAALRAGFRGIDTACQPRHYNEAGVGHAVAHAIGTQLVRREELYLQTKYTSVSGQDPNSIPYDPHAPVRVQVMQSFERSCTNLQTAYLDAIVLHSPLKTMQQTLEAWATLEELVARGAVRHLGISNCYDLDVFEQLCAKVQIKPSVLQNRFYADTDYDVELRDVCRAHGIRYQSFWTLTANPHLLQHRVIASLAHAYQRTPAQILFRYLTQVDVVPLTGTTSATHLREDLAIFEFELQPREQTAITQLLQLARA